MKKIPLFALTVLLLGGCGPTKSIGPKAAPTEGIEAVSTTSSTPMPSGAPTSALRVWKSTDSTIALLYPSYLTPMQDFPGTYFTPGGWRAMFDGAAAGPGDGLVRFIAHTSLEGEVSRRATEILQIGTSDDPSVLRDCLTSGLEGGDGAKQSDRMVGGVPFTVYTNGDAGMSHQLSSVDLRSVHDDRCIAIDWLTISVPAPVGSATPPKRPSSDVRHDFDAMLSSMTLR